MAQNQASTFKHRVGLATADLVVFPDGTGAMVTAGVESGINLRLIYEKGAEKTARDDYRNLLRLLEATSQSPIVAVDLLFEPEA